MTTPALERLALLARAARLDGDLLMLQVLTPHLMELKRRRGISRSMERVWASEGRARIIDGRRRWLDAREAAVIDEGRA